MKQYPKVVVIGGGTGTYAVLSGLKKYPVHLSAIVTMMDSGGSTGRLRDQLGVLPPGDLRQSLVALSESTEIWRNLFAYRFDNGDLEGHNFGNIFLSSLEMITGSNERAIHYAARLLKTKGKVIPVTLTKSTLCAKYSDGTILEGEKLIDYAPAPRARINYVYLSPRAVINPNARKAIETADFLIFGPGDLYTSIIPNLIVDDMDDAIRKSKANKIFCINLMTKLGQTDGFKASDFVTELYKYLGGAMVDSLVVNNKEPDKEVVDWYARSGDAFLVEDDLDSIGGDIEVFRGDLLSDTRYEQSLSDRIQRSLIRHDPDKLAKVLSEVIQKILG
ncbi:YvcK family protein [candidate division WWE3 bacterium]|jgi:uncharacterized cofD-like protein|uniref:Putative gluconeogenesis factor n=1 Tax=candidate division WWE3 bacterium TaxID=2053526 RepID=A0A3A4ZD40_UNCKA|nr:MAG: YvcK family protein [candidate division WWE3 bacterium]